MLARRVADGIQKRVVVLQLTLVSTRSRPKLERRESEFVDGFVQVAVRPVDPQVVDCHDGRIDGLVIDVHITESEFIYQTRVEDVSLGDAEEAVTDGQVERKVEIRLTDGAAERGSESACAKG